VSDVQFAITPKISIDPSAGGVGASITISGTGFGNAETNIVVTYDSLSVKSGIAADVKGSWNTSFTVPTSARGNHTISAYGAVTQPGSALEVTFSVSPFIRVDMDGGILGDAIFVGDGLIVSGIGFQGNEGGISILFDGNQVIGGVIADSKGSWSQKITVPASSHGKHTIDVSGQNTTAADVPDTAVSISPKATINPVAGNVGTEVTIVGNGFSGSKAISVNFGGTVITTPIASDTKGSFTAQIKVPAAKGGAHIITVADSSGSISTASFTMETTPPGIPSLLTPAPGTRIGSFGKDVLSFTWSAVEDPSGVEYIIEVAPAPDFASMILRKDSLKETAYTVPEEEPLDSGEYYWRVKAVDGAGNEGSWSTGQYFRIGGIQPWHIIAGILGLLLLGVIVWRVLRISKKGGWK